ncbi:MBL fold metallo-hydrolase [Streptomonospora nanhaiensis]|uniref:MBL fold metallo-hydrolase n=1 Tax=Streptomonospora nanhaiensis TaxID=1323731 RepID=UPI001C3818DC|nr:MBL fold metallo-hydrolase [Streptomonospora nanhaiensis]MBV2362193.1 MBL fold metallo-hydrolase [Streptomonospora nanhaiensis]MBX9388159.1 MBL fold metallo-hydrolase [Streptomonospora nanhaiensis]
MCHACATPHDGDAAQRPGISRRGLLRGTVAAGAAGLAAHAMGAAAAAPARADTSGGDHGVRLRWLGIAGWEMAFDGHRILVDPYLSRQEYRSGGSRMDPGKPIATDSRIIDWVLEEHLPEAPEFILVTHGHWDHIGDVAALLNHPRWRDQRIRVFGNETHLNLIRAMGVPAEREGDLVLVTGGEHLRYPLRSADHPRPAYTVEVFRSLHSQLGGYGFSPAGTLTSVPPKPATLGELVEGGSLAYQVTVTGRLSVMFLSGTANFDAREVAHTAPDVLVLGASGNAAVHDYFERALKTLDWPATVIPTHNDDLVTPLDDPGVHDTANRAVVSELRTLVGDRGRVLDPRHLEPFTV